MSVNVKPLAEVSQHSRATLEEKLTSFYSTSPEAYYTEADRSLNQYTPTVLPFHCDLVSRINAGDRVFEVGCGSAHLCGHVQAAGGHYTGLDHGEKLLEQNRTRYPEAQFLSLSQPPVDTFDIVASLYTIEHVVDPVAYLDTLWSFCRPGGLIGIICPDFIDGAELPASFFYGTTARRFRTKLATFSLWDATRHLLDLFWSAPRWKAGARAAAPGMFWINQAPRIFAGAAYSPDADAVHLPRLQDLTWWIERRGGIVLDTSRSVEAPENVLQHNCYLVARRPESGVTL